MNDFSVLLGFCVAAFGIGFFATLGAHVAKVFIEDVFR